MYVCVYQNVWVCVCWNGKIYMWVHTNWSSNALVFHCSCVPALPDLVDAPVTVLSLAVFVTATSSFQIHYWLGGKMWTLPPSPPVTKYSRPPVYKLTLLSSASSVCMVHLWTHNRRVDTQIGQCNYTAIENRKVCMKTRLQSVVGSNPTQGSSSSK